MRTRPFGRAGWPVSEIGLGTWTMSPMWGPSDDDEAIRAIHRALELGVNFIDTAWIYGQGQAETLLGRALAGQARPCYVATKVPPKNLEWPARHDAPAAEVFPAAWIRQRTDESLTRLRRDTLDLQQLHVWSPRWLAQAEVWLPAVEALKREGKIRAFGISVNDHEPETALEVVASGLIDSVQVIFNIFDQRPAEALLPRCQARQVAVIARVPFDEGSLAGGLTRETAFHPTDWRGQYFRGERLRDTVERVDRLRPLFEGRFESLAQAALAFCLAHPAVATVIPGAKRLRHVEDNCRASGADVTPELLARLRAHAWPRNFYR